ncbi:MAG: hypothetical protein HN348_25660, partial [Proteobacteria bacterium]|nr:hypothetical protein [Pseudomonadota bacterium]
MKNLGQWGLMLTCNLAMAPAFATGTSPPEEPAPTTEAVPTAENEYAGLVVGFIEGRLLVEVADEAALRPGREVAVYLWDQR